MLTLENIALGFAIALTLHSLDLYLPVTIALTWTAQIIHLAALDR